MAGFFSFVIHGPTFHGVESSFNFAEHFDPVNNKKIVYLGDNPRKWFGKKTIHLAKGCEAIGYELVNKSSLSEIEKVITTPSLTSWPAIKFWIEESEKTSENGGASFLLRDGRSSMFFVPMDEYHSDSSVIIGVFFKNGGWNVRGYPKEYSEKSREWFKNNMIVVPDYEKYKKQQNIRKIAS